MRNNERQSQLDFMKVIEKENVRVWIEKWARIVTYNYPSRYHFEDAVQEIKLQVYERYTRWYDPNRGTITGFVWTHSRQCAARIIEKQYSKKRGLYDEIEMEWPQSVIDPHGVVYEKDLLYTFVKVDLDRLGMHVEKTIIEHLRKGYTWKETEHELGIDKMTFCRKMRKIRGVYGQD